MVLYHCHRRVQRSAPSPTSRFQGLVHALVPVSSAATARLRRWVCASFCVSLPQKHVCRFLVRSHTHFLFCQGSSHHRTCLARHHSSRVSISSQSRFAQKSRWPRHMSPCWTNVILVVKPVEGELSSQSKDFDCETAFPHSWKFERTYSMAMNDASALAGANI